MQINWDAGVTRNMRTLGLSLPWGSIIWGVQILNAISRC